MTRTCVCGREFDAPRSVIGNHPSNAKFCTPGCKEKATAERLRAAQQKRKRRQA